MPRCIYHKGGSGAARQLTFRNDFNKSGYANLPQPLTINGVTKTPTFRYEAADATTSAWTAAVGSDLAIAGSGADVVVDEYAPGLTDKQVDFKAGKYYSGAAISGLTTGDVVYECIINSGPLDATAYIYHTNSFGSPGFQLYHTASSSSLRFYLRDGDGDIATATSPALTANTWYHLIFFFDKSGSCICYANATAGSAVSVTDVGSIVSTTAHTIGAWTNGTQILNNGISYCAIWHHDGWLDTHLQADLAKERFLRAQGLWAQKSATLDFIVDGDMEAVGVADWTAIDSTLSKTTTNPNSGSQALRITSTANTFYATQSITTINNTYRVRGFARSVSGSAIPRITNSTPAQIWIGTTSTDWQEFDFTFVSTGAGILFGSASAHPGVVDFDDIKVTRLGAYPTVSTRSTSAYIDKEHSNGNHMLVPVGAEWLRVCERRDTNSDLLAGYLPETAATNLIVTSQSGTTGWALVDGTDTANVDAADAPDGTTTAYEGIASTNNGSHGYDHASTTLTAASYTLSVWAKAGAVDWIKLECTTVANAYAYINVSTGALGTVGAAATARVGCICQNGFYRLEMTFTGTAAAHTMRLLSCDADNDDTFAGDGTSVSTYIWGMQCEAGDKASSYIKTLGTSATRAKDQLRFTANENIGGQDVGQGTVSMDILIPDYTTTNSLAWFSISDGNSGDNRILSYETSGVHRLICTDGGVAQASLTETVDLKDNKIHNIEALYKTNSIKMKIDGLEVGTEDTSCTIPDDIDYLEVGQSLAASQPNSLISNFKVYKKQV